MKKVLISISLILLFASSYSQIKPGGDKKPGIYFLKKVHNFGPLSANVSVSHDFKFVNTGNAPLIITNVSASCGCTTPKWTKQPVMPGDTGSVTVIFRTGSNTGNSVHKSISVMTNVPVNNNKKVVILAIKAFVKRKPLTQKGTQ